MGKIKRVPLNCFKSSDEDRPKKGQKTKIREEGSMDGHYKRHI